MEATIAFALYTAVRLVSWVFVTSASIRDRRRALAAERAQATVARAVSQQRRNAPPLREAAIANSASNAGRAAETPSAVSRAQFRRAVLAAERVAAGAANNDPAAGASNEASPSAREG